MNASKVFALVVLLSGGQVSGLLTPERGVVLHGEQAGWLLVPHCSRQVPGPVESAWAPDIETIRRLELTLGPVLQESLRSIPGRASDDYYRQYAGAVIGGERIVYINGFYGGLRSANALQWRTTAVGVQACDGGSNYFGAEYVEGLDVMRNLHFDGSATIAPRLIDPSAIPGTVPVGRIRND